jgi:hypothetical protein
MGENGVVTEDHLKKLQLFEPEMLENVTRGSNLDEELGKSAHSPIGQVIVSLLKQQNRILETQNSILERQNAEVLEKISAIGTKSEIETLFEKYLTRGSGKSEELLKFSSVVPVEASSALKGSETDVPDFSESMGKRGKRSEKTSGKQKDSAAGSRKKYS